MKLMQITGLGPINQISYKELDGDLRSAVCALEEYGCIIIDAFTCECCGEINITIPAHHLDEMDIISDGAFENLLGYCSAQYVLPGMIENKDHFSPINIVQLAFSAGEIEDFCCDVYHLSDLKSAKSNKSTTIH